MKIQPPLRSSTVSALDGEALIDVQAVSVAMDNAARWLAGHASDEGYVDAIILYEEVLRLRAALGLSVKGVVSGVGAIDAIRNEALAGQR